MSTVTRLDRNQVLLTDEISLTRYTKLLKVYLRGLEIVEEVLVEVQLLKGTGKESEHMDFLEEREFKNHSFFLGSEYSIGTLPSSFFLFTSEAAKTVTNEIKISLEKRQEQLQVAIQKRESKEVKDVIHCVECDTEWDAKFNVNREHMMSFYGDDIEDWETPDFLTNKVTDEVFCTLEGYARLSRLPFEIIFERTHVINGCNHFNMQLIDLDDKEVNIIPLTEVAKWLVNDKPGMAEWLIGSDGVILPADFITQTRNQRKRDTKPQAKSISVQPQLDSISKKVEGTVYLIGNRENNTLKIGFTTNDVRTRLAAFQVSCAHQLEVLKTKKGNLQDEGELLERFKKFKIRGEWFTWNDSIIENF